MNQALKIIQIPLPLPDTLTLSFGCVADQIIHLAIPKDFEIVKTDMVIQGDNFAGDVFPKSFGTTVLAKTADSDGFIEIDQDNNLPLQNVIAIIIDFHTQRTITGLELQEMIFPETLMDGFCILRIWSGGNWCLPIPKNLFSLGTISSSGTSTIKEGLPEIISEKIFLTFARLKRTDDTYVQHDETNGNLSALGLISIEEIALTSLNGLSVFTNDFLTNFFIQVGDILPVFQPEDEFYTYDQEFRLPDFSEQINQFMVTADPLSYNDLEIFADHPEFDYLKNIPFSLVPIRLHTDMSGILHINKLTFDYVRRCQDWKLEGETEFTSDEKTLSFERDEQRSSTIVRKLLIHLANLGSINFITMKLKGVFSNDRMIPLSEIQPHIASKIDSTLGFQIGTNKAAAQKIIFAKSYKLKGIDLRIKFVNKQVNYIVEIRNDQNSQPGDKILISKEMNYKLESANDQTPVRDFLWMQVDFEEIELCEGIYWIILRSTSGELVWQINELTGVGLNGFQYTFENSDSQWIPVSKSYGKEIHSIYRIRHTPLTFTELPSLRIILNNNVIWELLQDPKSVEIMIEKQCAISQFPVNTQSITIDFESQSTGELKISDLLIKFKEIREQRIQLNGFVQSLCFAQAEIIP